MSWNILRNNTSFVSNAIEFFKTLDKSDILRYHQQIVTEYFKKYPVRGMLFFHKMGMGKSLLAAAIANELLKTMDVLFISAKTLHANFNETLDKFTKLTGLEYTGKINYVSLNSSNMMTQVNRATLNKLEVLFERKNKMRGSLDNKFIIIDEAHNFFNSITNGSTNATKLYKAIMKSDCRLAFLTGSPITNDPFEIALCFNMLAGQTIFPETYIDFTSYFIKTGPNGRELKNAGKFSNRINGMVTFYDAGAITSNTAADFPTELPLKTIQCVMSKYQYGLYFAARKYEITQQLKKKYIREAVLQKTKSSNASYRVMSRQLSNFAYPESATTSRRNDVGKLIDEHHFDMLVATDVYDNIDDYSPKIKIACHNAVNLPGIILIYSQFLKYGLHIVAMYLDEMKRRGLFKNNYTIISGEIDKEEVAKFLHIINSEENKNGEIYKIILISGAASEGVDFKNIRSIHILEPYWHWSRILQIIGRGVRLGSHLMLPIKDRIVEPYIYISTHGIEDNKVETTDEYLLSKSMRNQHLIDSFYLVMRMSAVDCQMHYKECRKCPATNVTLFSEDILVDMTSPDPCKESRSVAARIFEYEGDTYAEYEDDGEIYFARLNSDTGSYERVTEEIRSILLKIIKK